MGFIRKAANAVLPFGLIGNALLKDKKKDKPQTPSLAATDTTGTSTPSLLSTKYGG